MALQTRTRRTLYTHTQSTPLSVITVIHGLQAFPAVTLVNASGSVVHAALTYSDEDTVIVTCDTPFSGTIYLGYVP